MARRRTFGSVRQLPSKDGPGRWQARFTDPVTGRQRTARTEGGNRPLTFTSRKEAERWLARTDLQIQRGEWKPPDAKPKVEKTLTLTEYAEKWLAKRETKDGKPLRPSTKQSYRGLLDNLILPELGDLPLASINQDVVDDWWDSLDADTPTYRSHAAQLLRAILRTAYNRKRLIPELPLFDRMGSAKRAHNIVVLELDELDKLVGAMPERFRPMVLIMAWCGLRYGEASALRARHIDLKRGVVKVETAVTRTAGEWNEGPPKNGDEGRVSIPPHLLDEDADDPWAGIVRKHVTDLAPNDLLFPSVGGTYMHSANFQKIFSRAAEAAGRPDVRVHDLRHLGSVLAALAGASVPELMHRLRHRTASASPVYWHVARGRDSEIAAAMSELANGRGGRTKAAVSA